MSTETGVVSFVLRFVCDDPTDGVAIAARCTAWHGVIRHVQTNEELHFAHWPDAVGFISKYVNINEGPGSLPPSQPPPS